METERVIRGGIRFSLGNVRDEEHTTETNDCTVRALKVAAGVPYADAHSLCSSLGRRPRKGMTSSQLLTMTSLPHVYGYKVTRVDVPWNQTLGRAMLYMLRGRYLVIKTGHAIGVRDGVCYDMGTSGPSSRVKMILKFTPCSELETKTMEVL
jgi:hypothetical protein